MAPTVQQFPQPNSGFFPVPPVLTPTTTATHLFDRPSLAFNNNCNNHNNSNSAATVNNNNNSGNGGSHHHPFQFPVSNSFPPLISGCQINPSKFFAACLSSLCSEPEEKEKLDGPHFLPPPSTPWKRKQARWSSSEPPVMINGVPAFKKTSNVVQISPLRTAFIPTPSELSELTNRGPVSEDANFQRHQLVPRTFLTQPLWSQLIPSNFVTRSRATHLTLPCTSIFVLEPKANKILFRPAHFVVTVTGPGESVVPVQMRTDCDQHGKELRYVYCFRPQEPGIYTAKVRIAANGIPHVSQSPIRFRVTKSLPPPPPPQPCPSPHQMMTRSGGIYNNTGNHNGNSTNHHENLLSNNLHYVDPCYPWRMRGNSGNNNNSNNNNGGIIHSNQNINTTTTVINSIMTTMTATTTTTNSSTSHGVISSCPELGVIC